jgi:hypothetical protein
MRRKSVEANVTMTTLKFVSGLHLIFASFLVCVFALINYTNYSPTKSLPSSNNALASITCASAEREEEWLALGFTMPHKIPFGRPLFVGWTDREKRDFSLLGEEY